MLSLHLLGKPNKKKLVYTVNVTEKGMSDLELESDLIEPISSGKNTGPKTSETHFTATELEASKEKAAQEEQKDVVTLETFGLPPVATKVSLGTDGGETQSSTEKVQNEKSDDNQPVTSKDEENTLKKVDMCNCYMLSITGYFILLYNVYMCWFTQGGPYKLFRFVIYKIYMNLDRTFLQVICTQLIVVPTACGF